MEIKLLYFAHVRQAVGKDSEQICFEEGSQVSDVLDVLSERYPTLRALLPVIRVALNGTFVDPDTPLVEDAEVVLIPPVSGGAGPLPRVALSESPLTPGILNELITALMTPQRGAVATFTGVVRDYADGRQTDRLYYEAYRSMALRTMQSIADEIEATHDNLAVAVHHRLGMLEVGEWAVVVVVTSGHRAEAFASCRAMIDRLKQEVPIWKQEHGPNGEVWV